MPSRRDLANAIRALSMDAVQQANSGHPGAPMGMADIAEVLWRDYLKHNPSNPLWADRDRFVLSNGHGSMLIYSLLHLTGYDLSIDDLKNFRQLHSKTPGHPEAFHTPGVETTTGPRRAWPMPWAWRWRKSVGARFNRPEHEIVNHWTWVLAGDGCLMEGISHEVASLAGTLKLGKLVVLYDDNGISIDGQVDGWFTDDTVQRSSLWLACGCRCRWPRSRCHPAGHRGRPRGGAPQPDLLPDHHRLRSPNKAGKRACMARPWAEEITATRKALDWPHEPFEVPAAIKARWDAPGRGMRSKEWQRHFEARTGDYPELAAEFERRLRGELPEQFRQAAHAHIQAMQRTA